MYISYKNAILICVHFYCVLSNIENILGMYCITMTVSSWDTWRMTIYLILRDIPSRAIRVLVVFTPNLALWPLHAALLPCSVPYWWLTSSIHVLTGILFRRSVPGRRVPPFCQHKARSLRQGLCTPHAAPPPREKTKSNRMTRLSTCTKRGGIWTDAWVCLHYWVVIWVAG